MKQVFVKRIYVYDVRVVILTIPNEILFFKSVETKIAWNMSYSCIDVVFCIVQKAWHFNKSCNILYYLSYENSDWAT